MRKKSVKDILQDGIVSSMFDVEKYNPKKHGKLIHRSGGVTTTEDGSEVRDGWVNPHSKFI